MRGPLGFDLRSLEVFVTMCGTHSMTAAANRLGMTQSAVSQTIRQLERNFGLSLIDRRKRPFRVTAAGEYVRQTATHLLHDAQSMPRAVRQFGKGLPPGLRIGLVDSLTTPFVPELLLRMQGPLSYLSVSAGLAHSLRVSLQEHVLDMVISNDAMDGKTVVWDAQARDLTGERRVAPPDLGSPTRIILVRHGVTPFTVDGRLETFVHPLPQEPVSRSQLGPAGGMAGPARPTAAHQRRPHARDWNRQEQARREREPAARKHAARWQEAPGSAGYPHSIASDRSGRISHPACCYIITFRRYSASAHKGSACGNSHRKKQRSALNPRIISPVCG